MVESSQNCFLKRSESETNLLSLMFSKRSMTLLNKKKYIDEKNI